ncbi:MAG: hypothetical protein ACLVAW_22295 [Eisenbergiella massiliensis]
MKKILCYLLTGIMAAGVLAGCGQKAQTGTENTAAKRYGGRTDRGFGTDGGAFTGRGSGTAGAG